MSDFFADLEQELRTAQRGERRARGATIRRAVALAAAAAVILAVAGTVLRGASDPERSVPAGEPPVTERSVVTSCISPDEQGLPRDLREHFSIFGATGDEWDVPPPPEVSVLEGGGVERDFSEHARLTRLRGLPLAVHPVLIEGGCDGGRLAAGICLGVYDAEERSDLACAPVSEILAGGLSVRSGDHLVVLTDDDVTRVTAGSESGEPIHNLTVLDPGPGWDDDRPSLIRGGNTYEPPPADTRPCAEVGKLDGPVPPEVTEHFTVFGQPDMSDYSQGGADFGDRVAAVYFRGGTTIARGGDEFALVAGRVPVGAGPDRPCDELPVGLCLGRLGGPQVTCAPVEFIREKGLMLRISEGDSARYVVLVPDGVTHVRFSSGARQSVQDNVASVRLRDDAEVVALERP